MKLDARETSVQAIQVYSTSIDARLQAPERQSERTVNCMLPPVVSNAGSGRLSHSMVKVTSRSCGACEPTRANGQLELAMSYIDLWAEGYVVFRK
jgi:hypothetical protein